MFEKTGTWNYVFLGSAALALLSALMALYVRKIPLPQKAERQEFSVQPSVGLTQS